MNTALYVDGRIRLKCEIENSLNLRLVLFSDWLNFTGFKASTQRYKKFQSEILTHRLALLRFSLLSYFSLLLFCGRCVFASLPFWFLVVSLT